MRSPDRRDPSAIEARIRDALAGLRPLLHFESAHLELVRFEAASGVALLRLDGACPDCDLTAATLRQGIEAHLRLRVPEVREVRTV
jgi:Fe-S cluster biogenesis protein NfuA